MNLLLSATNDISRHNIFELCEIVKSHNPVIAPRFDRSGYKADIYIHNDDIDAAIALIENALDPEDFIDLHFPSITSKHH
jgi:hypothetical protein